MAKNEHIRMWNSGVKCFNCGTYAEPNLPAPVDHFNNFLKGFELMHSKCPKTWQEPECDAQTTTEQMQWWLTNGEQGISSKTIFSKLSGLDILARKFWDAPYDPSDLNRCVKLLNTVSEWKARIGEMAEVSAVWANYVANWDVLCKMLEEQLEIERSGKKLKEYKLWERMKFLRSEGEKGRRVA